MKTLILMRHAKSAWGDPSLSDHARPLNARGRAAAPLMGRWLRDRRLVPDLAIVSDAVRTRDTWARMGLDGAPMRASGALYHARAEALLAVLRGAPDAARALLLLGHQPGMGDVLAMLARERAPADCRRAFRKFPTAAIAVLEFDAPDWSAVAPGGGRFSRFVTPGDLA